MRRTNRFRSHSRRRTQQDVNTYGHQRDIRGLGRSEQPSMTTRNLNRTWRDVVFKQYEQDHEADVPFPVRYLINVTTRFGWKGDIFIEIPTKVDPRVLRRALLDWYRAVRTTADIAHRGEHISVRPRRALRPHQEPSGGGAGLEERQEGRERGEDGQSPESRHDDEEGSPKTGNGFVEEDRNSAEEIGV